MKDLMRRPALSGRWLFLLTGLGLLAAADVTYYEEALPTSLNPLFARTMVDHRTHELLFDRLVFRSPINHTLRSRVLVEASDTPKVEVLDGAARLVLAPIIGSTTFAL